MNGAASPAILEVIGARKAYGPRTALAGVDLALSSGEIYALLGPNGAGKTTLIRAVCGRLVLDAGHVRVAGRDPSADAEARRSLGLVPQEIALYPELTTRENLEVLGRLAGIGRSSSRDAAGRALGWAGLAARADDRVRSLSGGMRRRLNLAAGTLHGPRLLLLDEPTVGVDPDARDRIHQLLRRLRREGMAILITTHDLEQAEHLADRIGILVDGRLRDEGTLDDLVRRSFGEAKEITVAFTAPPDQAERGVLRDAGLEPLGDERRWSGRLEGGLDRLSTLGGRIAASALAIDEIRVREPGLRGVFSRLTGKEFEP